MKNNNITQKVSGWLAKEEKFCDLILTPDGNLFVDANFESRADRFLIFYNGNICMRPNSNMYCLGSLPNSCTTFPIYAGESIIYANDEMDCVLRSVETILDCDFSAFAVLQYGDMLCMYTADTTLSRRIHFRAMANTPKNMEYIVDVFFQQLKRHKPELTRKAIAWLTSHFNQSEEV